MEECQVEKGERELTKKRENMTWEVREKIIKKIKYKATVTVHICTVTIANVQICTLLEALM